MNQSRSTRRQHYSARAPLARMHANYDGEDSGVFTHTVMDGTNITPADAFRIALDRNDVEMLRSALKKDRTLANQPLQDKYDCFKVSPLTFVVRRFSKHHGPLELVQELLKQKADVKAKDKFGHTALYCAVVRDNLKLVALLLQLGADVNARTDCNETPLHQAKNKNMVQLLVKYGADVNDKDSTGDSVLLKPVKAKDVESAMILEHGALGRATDQAGMTNNMPKVNQHNSANLDFSAPTGKTAKVEVDPGAPSQDDTLMGTGSRFELASTDIPISNAALKECVAPMHQATMDQQARGVPTQFDNCHCLSTCRTERKGGRDLMQSTGKFFSILLVIVLVAFLVSPKAGNEAAVQNGALGVHVTLTSPIKLRHRKSTSQNSLNAKSSTQPQY